MGSTNCFGRDSGYIGLIFEIVFKDKEILYDQLKGVFLHAGTVGEGHKTAIY